MRLGDNEIRRTYRFFSFFDTSIYITTEGIKLDKGIDLILTKNRDNCLG